jgi:hypothetical protein
VRRFGTWPLVVAAVGLMWAGFAYTATRPSDSDDYRRTAVQVAEAGHDAARTGWLAGRQQLAGQIFPPFANTSFSDATRALAGAAKEFVGEPPPDPQSTALRDELAPLLQETVRQLGYAAGAADDTELRRAVDALDSLAEQFEEFVEAHR